MFSWLCGWLSYSNVFWMFVLCFYVFVSILVYWDIWFISEQLREVRFRRSVGTLFDSDYGNPSGKSNFIWALP